MKRLLSTALAAALLAFTAAPSHAAGWVAVLKNTPAETYDAEDLRLLLDAALVALKADGEPQPVAWRNAATGASGRFLELGRSVDKQGQACKRLRVWIDAPRRNEMSMVLTACQAATGRWGLSNVAR